MIKKIRYWIITTVGISKTEANALLILVPLLFLIITVPPFFNSYIDNSYSNRQSDQLILDSLLARLESNKKKQVESIHLISRTKFDPNTASLDALLSNGIPEHIANRLVNYRSKGGFFREKEDLKKIYGFEEKLYKTLIPFIEISKVKKRDLKTNSSSFSENKSRQIYQKKAKIIAFDINEADTTTLKQVYGIGSKLSLRIVKFRNKLGGFINTKQVYSVYGLNPQAVDSLLKYGNISTDFKPSKININTDTVNNLSQHPYISYRTAKAIVNYRNQHDDYRTIEQLKEIHLINDSIYSIISPYLKTSY